MIRKPSGLGRRLAAALGVPAQLRPAPVERPERRKLRVLQDAEVLEREGHAREAQRFQMRYLQGLYLYAIARFLYFY